MFTALANLIPETATSSRSSVFLISPVQLSRWLDEVWSKGGRIPPILDSTGSPFLGEAKITNTLDLPLELLAQLESGIDPHAIDNWKDNLSGPTSSTVGGPDVPLIWHHLIYAYLIESTGVVEVFAEVLRRYAAGETVGQFSQESVRWARATEDLFFRDQAPFSIAGLTSELRPDSRVNRRNAYWRMFGLDLPHPIPARWGGKPDTAWKADAGGGVNLDFRSKWTELLRQVWLGVEHAANTSGPKAVDPTYIALLCSALRDMLNNRRRSGQLAREEFAYVTMMNWFHLTLTLPDTPIVKDLGATATNPADRLAGVAQRVGMTPAARSRELFDLAEPTSTVLRAIELGMFDDRPKAELFYNGNQSQLRRDITNVIDNWQSATGERVKERPIGTVVDAQPVRVPTPAVAKPALVTANGRH